MREEGLVVEEKAEEEEEAEGGAGAEDEEVVEVVGGWENIGSSSSSSSLLLPPVRAARISSLRATYSSWSRRDNSILVGARRSIISTKQHTTHKQHTNDRWVVNSPTRTHHLLPHIHTTTHTHTHTHMRTMFGRAYNTMLGHALDERGAQTR